MSKSKYKDLGPNDKRVATNRQASHHYEILETREAGIVLTGTEVKSLRAGLCQIMDGYARFEKGELFLHSIHIGPYEQGNIHNHLPTAPRKLLLHKNELRRYFGLLSQKGLTIVPLSVYFKGGLVKCDIGIAKSKKVYDRRVDIKKRISQRETDRAIKDRFRK
jgi:SsrA-binding protein